MHHRRFRCHPRQKFQQQQQQQKQQRTRFQGPFCGIQGIGCSRRLATLHTQSSGGSCVGRVVVEVVEMFGEGGGVKVVGGISDYYYHWTKQKCWLVVVVVVVCDVWW